MFKMHLDNALFNDSSLLLTTVLMDLPSLCYQPPILLNEVPEEWEKYEFHYNLKMHEDTAFT